MAFWINYAIEMLLLSRSPPLPCSISTHQHGGIADESGEQVDRRGFRIIWLIRSLEFTRKHHQAIIRVRQ